MFASCVEADGELVYLGGGPFTVLDVSDPAAVARLGGYDTPALAYAVEVVGNLAYVADDQGGVASFVASINDGRQLVNR